MFMIGRAADMTSTNASFVVRATKPRITPIKADGYVVGHRLWHLSEIEQSTEDFAPRRLALLLPSIIRGEYPKPPIDCGV